MNENKLIAEFMGRDEYYKGMSEARAKRIFNFHTSWDWLMPVVEKIEDEGYSFERNKQEDGDWQCLIVKGYDIIHQTFGDCSREATHNAVVEFIKRHNK